METPIEKQARLGFLLDEDISSKIQFLAGEMELTPYDLLKWAIEFMFNKWIGCDLDG